jgi:hypothetical protein
MSDVELETDKPTQANGRGESFNMSRAEKLGLYAFGSLLVIASAVCAIAIVNHQCYKYDSLLVRAAKMQSGPMTPGMFAVYSLNLTLAQDGLAMRYAAMFLSFIIVVAGCMFVVSGARASYGVRIEHASFKGALATASPGLVLISLGAGLMLGALSHETSVAMNYNIPPVPDQPLSGPAGTVEPASGTQGAPDGALVSQGEGTAP